MEYGNNNDLYEQGVIITIIALMFVGVFMIGVGFGAFIAS